MANYGIFDKLGFPPSLSANTITYSDSTIKSLNSVPALLTDWQMEDIATGNANGYFINPANSSINTINTQFHLISTISINVDGLENILLASNNVIESNNITDFLDHTDRLSNVKDPSVDADLPHYQTAIAAGKILSYLLYQSDGISNNAVFIGNFGSIVTYNTVVNYATTVTNDRILIQNSIVEDLISGNYSTLTTEQKTAITSNITSLNNFIYTTMTSDKNFYANCRNIISQYSTTREFNGLGESQNYLINNFIGSPKLLSRL